MIETLYNMGKLGEKVPGGPDLTDGDMKAAHAARAKATTSPKM